MKRLSFIATLCGARAAAQVVTSRGEACIGVPPPRTHLGQPVCKPKNGECPVCGTMADPFTAIRVSRMKQCDPPRMDGLICVEPGDAMESTTRLKRCRTCNAAFWQDEEPAK